VNLVVAWAREHWKNLAIWTPVAALVLYVGFCHPKKNPVPPKEQHTIDSLAITQPAFQAHRDTLILRETTYVRASTQEARKATIATHAADSLRTIADAAQARAVAAGDTLSEWRAAALARQQEADTLRSALSTTTHALDLQILARIAADDRATASEQRLTAVQNLSERLARDVQAAGQCRVLFVARCPSRKAVAVASLAVGSIGTIVILNTLHRN
jgi:hypothetical protein